MKVLKKYKWIILGFVILFLIIIGWIVKDLFLVEDGALYGNRLEGKEDTPITDDVKDSISDLLLSKSGVSKVSINVQGIIIYIIIYVDNTMTIDKVKEIANESLTKLSSEQLALYDVSVLVDYAEGVEGDIFPKIGYKNKNSDSIVW